MVKGKVPTSSALTKEHNADMPVIIVVQVRIHSANVFTTFSP